MSGYEQYSKEELIQRICELEARIQKQPKDFITHDSSKEFKEDHGSEILDTLPDMLSVFDVNYNFIALASSEKTVHVGGSSENLIGKNLLEILPPDAYIPVKTNFDRVIATGNPSISYHNLYVEGKLENFENRVIPLNDNHLLCICRNITDTVKAQNELQMITTAVNNSTDEIYAVKKDGTLIFANKQFLNHHNLSGDLTGYKIYDLLSDTSPESWNEQVSKLEQAGGSNNYTTIHQFADGRQIPQEIYTYVLKDKNKNDIIWHTARDISERLEKESKIHELNQLMETILNNIPVYLFVKNTADNFRYLYWNKEFEKKSGIPANKVIGKTDIEIFPNAENARKFKEDDLELLRSKQTVDFEEDYVTAEGECRNVHTIKTLAPLDGKQPLLIGISWDITEQKRTEQELIKSRIKAEESDKLKSAFLANMSHEIRTPLNAIVGFSKLLAETEENEERLQYSDIIEKNTDLLLQLINDILDLSKIEAGMLDFQYRAVNLHILCQGIFDTFLPRTPQKVRLNMQLPEQSATIRTDSNRVAQVLSNLLNNAQKFTTEGEIRFGYTIEEKWIKFFVRDTGMGIAKENIDKVFNRFTKLNNFVQGTGLGLPICRMIIENLGGSISLESEEHSGTEFRFTLPYNEVAVPQKPETAQQTLMPQKEKQQKTILIAEDVESNFFLLKTLLKKEYQLLRAQNGKEAIAVFEKEAPDLILMDIKMPEMDGMEATRIIRSRSSSIPIIALTAFAFESDKEAALEAGCNDFLVKPVSATLLRQALEKYI